MSPPGWYPDPWLPTRWRYFDGAAWTGWVHPPTAPPQPATPANAGYSAADWPAPEVVNDPSASVRGIHDGPRPGINSSPAAWWWAGGTLGVLLIVFLGLAWVVNR